jgi:hypothetical protein
MPITEPTIPEIRELATLVSLVPTKDVLNTGPVTADRI